MNAMKKHMDRNHFSRIFAMISIAGTVIAVIPWILSTAFFAGVFPATSILGYPARFHHEAILSIFIYPLLISSGTFFRLLSEDFLQKPLYRWVFLYAPVPILALGLAGFESVLLGGMGLLFLLLSLEFLPYRIASGGRKGDLFLFASILFGAGSLLRMFSALAKYAYLYPVGKTASDTVGMILLVLALADQLMSHQASDANESEEKDKTHNVGSIIPAKMGEDPSLQVSWFSIAGLVFLLLSVITDFISLQIIKKPLSPITAALFPLIGSALILIGYRMFPRIFSSIAPQKLTQSGEYTQIGVAVALAFLFPGILAYRMLPDFSSHYGHALFMGSLGMISLVFVHRVLNFKTSTARRMFYYGSTIIVIVTIYRSFALAMEQPPRIALALPSILFGVGAILMAGPGLFVFRKKDN